MTCTGIGNRPSMDSQHQPAICKLIQVVAACHPLLFQIFCKLCYPYAPFLFKGIKDEALTVFSRHMLHNVRNLFFFCLNVKYKTTFPP